MCHYLSIFAKNTFSIMKKIWKILLVTVAVAGILAATCPDGTPKVIFVDDVPPGSNIH